MTHVCGGDVSARAPRGTRVGSDNGKPVARPGRKATGLVRDSRAAEEPFRESVKNAPKRLTMLPGECYLLESPHVARITSEPR